MYLSTDIWKNGQRRWDADEKCKEFVRSAGKIDSFSFRNEMLCFLCYYRLISRDLQESKTEVISSIGYKNTLLSGIQ